MIPAISLAYENKEADIMQKPPRNALTDRLVTGKLINFAYLQIGVIQAVAGFFSYITVLNDYGFPPWILVQLDEVWSAFRLHDLGKLKMGADIDQTYVCGEATRAVSLNGTSSSLDNIVSNWATSSCATGKPRLELFSAANYPDLILNPQIYPGLTATRVEWLHDTCHIAEGNMRTQQDCWNPKNALAYAQCAFFVSIIIVQWADLMCCKTRTLSIKTQGMSNLMMNFGLVFETGLGLILCYAHSSINMALGTRDIEVVHWFCALPFMLFILTYDETRKWLLRHMGKDNWFYRNTYY
jgi:magnesium-transporting ATPase (P-type)